MKTLGLIFTFLFLTSFNNPKSYQFTIQNFVNMAAFDSNKFETYILEKGFDYYKTKEYSTFEVVYYKKTNRIISKSVSKETGEIEQSVFYETGSKDEYAFLKNQALKTGYKFVGSEKHSIDNDNTTYHNFKKGKITLSFYTSDRETYLGYCMGITIE